MTAARKPRNPRTRDLAAIHAAAHKLGLDRATYVELVRRAAGVESSADADARGRGRILDELRRLGAPMPPQRARQGRPANLDREPMLAKIGALLAELQAPWSYADAIARHMYRIERVAWLRKPEQLRAVIAALDARRLKLLKLEEEL